VDNNKKQKLLINISDFESSALNYFFDGSEEEKEVYKIIDRNITSIKKQIKNL